MTNPLKIFEEETKTLLNDALEKLNLKTEIVLETPPEGKGDFAFACFPLSKIAKKAPDKIAEDIVKNIGRTESMEKVENIGGYVNFYIDEERLKENIVKSILEGKEKYGFFDKKNVKIILEHTSTNPTGPVHVGRARNPIIGDSLARLLKAYGYALKTEYYVNDMGKQTAILAWGAENIKEKSDEKRENYRLVKIYQKANKMMESDTDVEKQVNQLLLRYEHGDKDVEKLVKNVCNSVLSANEETLRKLNISVDDYVHESTFTKNRSVDEIIEKLKKSEYCKDENGAYYLDLKKFGIHGRDTRFFFTRKDGTSLYATRDLAYHLHKFKNSDIAIKVLGEDHKLETKQIGIALDILGVKKKPETVFYSFVSLPEGKMSTRKGAVVYIDDLIDEAVERAYNEVKKRRKEFSEHEFKKISEKEMKKIAETIGTGAVRYNIIRVQNEKQIVFKWEDALNFEGNSAPFIQYAHARACSILGKSKGYKKFDVKFLNDETEIRLIKTLARFPNAVEESAVSRKPHKIASYVFELASAFNQFYRDMPVLKAEKDEKNARLALVDCFRIVLRNALNLLGIDAPEEM
jgi:arginyl-tRNA synthetase